MSLDENSISHVLAVCRREQKSSGEPTNDCVFTICQQEVGPKPASGHVPQQDLPNMVTD
jgi:hypothetical protein